MVATIAADRAKRALLSKTRTSVQAVNYRIGDQVEFRCMAWPCHCGHVYSLTALSTSNGKATRSLDIAV
eukprot:2265284-Prorocentrum_lima.AAC.1